MNNELTGNLISVLRKEKGLTQEKLGESIGVSGKTVSKWERGICMPCLNKLELVAKELNVSVLELMNGKLSNKLTLEEVNETSKKCFKSYQKKYKKIIYNKETTEKVYKDYCKQRQ